MLKGLGFSLGISLAMAAPAMAQFGAPFGGGYGNPGLYAAPEGSAGAIGAGAGNSAASQQQCSQSAAVGRDGPRTYCSPGRTPPDPTHR